MLGDHGALGASMASLVPALGATPVTTLDSAHETEVRNLASQSGTAFDQAYAAQQVQDHAATIQLFQQEAANTGGNATLVSVAQQALPLLQAHEAAANQLAAGGAPTAAMEQAAAACRAAPAPRARRPVVAL